MKTASWGLMLLLVACQQQSGPVLPVTCPDLLAGCRLDGGIVLKLSGKPSALQPFALEVDAPQASSVHASFAMRGMDMGPNRYRLLRENGKWRARVLLPACVQGRRDWLLRLEAGGRVYEVPFTAG